MKFILIYTALNFSYVTDTLKQWIFDTNIEYDVPQNSTLGPLFFLISITLKTHCEVNLSYLQLIPVC